MDLTRLFSLTRSADGLKATLTLREQTPAPRAAGVREDPFFDAVRAAVVAQRILGGDDLETFRIPIRGWIDSGKRRDLVIAQGQAPVHGMDAVLTFHVARPRLPGGAPVQPPQSPARRPARVEARNAGYVVNVELGTLLATRSSATRGTPGRSVTGDALPAIDGRPLSPELGGGVEAEESGEETLYRATRTGILQALGPDRIAVGDSIDIPQSVDARTGNIDAWGSVRVHGSIDAGFAVRARGSIRVDGVCESAFVDAGGDVAVGAGVLGRFGPTEVRARGTITAQFIENARVEAGGDVRVRDAIVHSRVLSAGTIEVVGRGVVLSSYLAAGRAVVANTFGSEAHLPVEVVVGADPIAWRRLERARRELHHLARLMKRRASGGHRRDDRRARSASGRAATVRLGAEQSRRTAKRREAEALGALFHDGGPRVVIRRGAHPKTTLRLGPRLYEVTAEHPRGTVRYDDGEVTFVPGEDKP